MISITDKGRIAVDLASHGARVEGLDNMDLSILGDLMEGPLDVLELGESVKLPADLLHKGLDHLKALGYIKKVRGRKYEDI